MDALKTYLEELLDLKRMASIAYRSLDGGVAHVKGHIVKLEKVSGRDSIETDAGIVLGADQIVQINGRHFESYC